MPSCCCATARTRSSILNGTARNALRPALSARNVFDYIELTDEYSIYEIPPLDNWVGRSVRDVDVRNKYHINILAVKEDGALKPLPGGDYRFTGREHLLAMAAREDAKKLLRKI